MTKENAAKMTLSVCAIILFWASCSLGDGVNLHDDNWVPMNQVRATENNMVNAIGIHGGKILIGGNFSQIGLGDAKKLAMWDGNSWAPFGNGDSIYGGMANSINAICFDSSGNTYIGGSYNAIGALRARNVAKWNGVSWDSLAGGITEIINTITFQSDSHGLFAAGNCHIENDVPHWIKNYSLNVWAWNDTSWNINASHALGQWNDYSEDYCPYPNMQLNQIGFDSHRNLYSTSHTSWQASGASGLYLEAFAINSSPYNYFVGWYLAGKYYDGDPYYNKCIVKKHVDSTAEAAKSDFAFNSSKLEGSRVNALVVDKNGIAYMGGDFTVSAGDGNAKNIALWDGSRFYSVGKGVSGPVNALALNDEGTMLYVGGNFDMVGNVKSPMIAAVDLTKRTSVSERTNAAKTVRELSFVNSRLTMRGFSPHDRIELYTLAGQLLKRSDCGSMINLQGLASRHLLIRISGNKRASLSRLFLK